MTRVQVVLLLAVTAAAGLVGHLADSLVAATIVPPVVAAASSLVYLLIIRPITRWMDDPVRHGGQ